ncbi:hypothetical protein BH18CHL2_BH18CHL2_11240 [soil metagenome]
MDGCYDRIRLIGQLRKKPRKRGFFYGRVAPTPHADQRAERVHDLPVRRLLVLDAGRDPSEPSAVERDGAARQRV